MIDFDSRPGRFLSRRHASPVTSMVLVLVASCARALSPVPCMRSDRLQQAVRVVTTEAASCYGQLVVLGHKVRSAV